MLRIDKQHRTTSSYSSIHIQFDRNPYDLSVKPVRCSTLNDISGYKQINANNHSWTVIASNVLDGTCYQLNINAPTPNSFRVTGDLHS